MNAERRRKEREKIEATPEDIHSDLWEIIEKRHQNAQRAKLAFINGNQTPRPTREAQQAPEVRSRQFIPATTTEHIRDTRLVPGARLCLSLIVGLLGQSKSGRISLSGLAWSLEVSKRTIRRYLEQLEKFGYIRRSLIEAANGWVLAGKIEITGRVKMVFSTLRKRPKKVEKRSFQERTEFTPSNTSLIKISSVTEGFALDMEVGQSPPKPCESG